MTNVFSSPNEHVHVLPKPAESPALRDVLTQVTVLPAF